MFLLEIEKGLKGSRYASVVQGVAPREATGRTTRAQAAAARERFAAFEVLTEAAAGTAETPPAFELGATKVVKKPTFPGCNCATVCWAANKRFEISKFNFKFPRARTCEMIGLVLGCIEAKFYK